MKKSSLLEKHLQAYYSKILSELKRGTPITQICNRFSANIEMVKDIAEKNNVSTKKSVYKLEKKLKIAKTNEERKNRKLKLEEDVKNLLETRKYKYVEIGAKLGISKNKVKRISEKLGIDLLKEKRDKYGMMIEDIYRDYYSGMPYEQIHTKYNLGDTIITGRLRAHGLGPLYRKSKKHRDSKILNEYKSGKKAIEIVNSRNPDIINPKRLTGLSSIYNTCSSLGYKKYPNIGRRIDGGTFESDKNLKFIKNCREKKKMTFEEIAKLLRKKGAKTVSGKEFSMANVIYKYGKAIEKGI